MQSKTKSFFSVTDQERSSHLVNPIRPKLAKSNVCLSVSREGERMGEVEQVIICTFKEQENSPPQY